MNESSHLRAQQDQQDTADLTQGKLMFGEKGAEHTGRRPNRDERDGEAAHERQRVQRRRASQSRAPGFVRLLTLPDAWANQTRDVDRCQRQHTRRDKRE